MKVKTGIDILHLPTFAKRCENTSGQLLQNILTETELLEFTSQTSRAGAFAAKEAVMKAWGIGAGKWHQIHINRHESGKPSVSIEGHEFNSGDISISHHEDYCVALAVFLVD
jgi:phosphopantetheine--protein transferase-like protein